MDKDYKHVKKLFDKFLSRITSEAKEIYLNGDKDNRYPGNLNLVLPILRGNQ